MLRTDCDSGFSLYRRSLGDGSKVLHRRERAQIIDAGCAANFVYRLSSASEGALGKLEIRWRSQLGDSGRLQTQQILAAPALSRDASLAAVSLPAVRRRGLCCRPPPAAVVPACEPLPVHVADHSAILHQHAGGGAGTEAQAVLQDLCHTVGCATRQQQRVSKSWCPGRASLWSDRSR